LGLLLFKCLISGRCRAQAGKSAHLAACGEVLPAHGSHGAPLETMLGLLGQHRDQLFESLVRHQLGQTNAFDPFETIL
jgi:hypothetical protein